MVKAESRITRERILLRAREKFSEEGFSSVSMDDIATDLGMSKKTFYRFFASKDELLERVVERNLAEARLTLSSVFMSEGKFPEKIQRIALVLGTIISRTSKPLLRDVERHHPALWQRIESFRRERIQYWFVKLVDQGMAEGYVRRDIHPRVLLLSYVAAINRIMVPSVLYEESLAPTVALEGIISIFLTGILNDEGRRRLEEAKHSLPHHTTQDPS